MDYKQNGTAYISTDIRVDGTGKQWQNTSTATTASPNPYEICRFRLPCGLCQETNVSCFYQKVR